MNSDSGSRFEIVRPEEDKDEAYLPSRFRHSNVDRFTGVIEGVIQGRSEIRFKHDDLGLNPTTGVARVRDAALAIIRGKVYYSNIDPDLLRDCWPLYKVWADPVTREIVIQHRHKDKLGSDLLSTPVIDKTLRVGDANFHEILLGYAILFGLKELRGCITILGVVDEEVKRELSSQHNVDFYQKEPTLTLML